MSEALIFASTNPQYDDRLFIELQVQCIKFQAQTWGEHVVYRNCFWHSEQFLYTTCSTHVLQKECMYWLKTFDDMSILKTRITRVKYVMIKSKYKFKIFLTNTRCILEPDLNCTRFCGATPFFHWLKNWGEEKKIHPS